MGKIIDFFYEYITSMPVIFIIGLLIIFLILHYNTIPLPRKYRKQKSRLSLTQWINMFYSQKFLVVNLLAIISIGYCQYCKCFNNNITPLLWVIYGLLNISYIAIKVLYKIKHVYKKNYTWILTIQVLLMSVYGIAIIYIVIRYNLNKETFVPFGIGAALIVLIFQDSIKGFMAGIHLRINSMLHIGDWIEVPSHNIDGTIENITLLNVTVRNWDESQSSISINQLLNGAFKNNRDILATDRGKGRRMYRSFIIDSRSIKTFNDCEVADLKKLLEINDQPTVFFSNVNRYKELNITLFRNYIFNWLQENPDIISMQPRTFITMRDSIPEGIPIIFNIFLKKDRNRQQFEKAQSEIMDHIILSMSWFGLKIYQRPSADDFNKFNS